MLVAQLWLLALGCWSDRSDPDGDGLTNAEEARLGTDPHRADSDGDGKSDGLEVHTYGTDPTRLDSDGDGVGDGAEISKYKTDPLVVDHEPVTPPPEPEAPEPTPKPPKREVEVGAPAPPERLRCTATPHAEYCYVHVPGASYLRGAQSSDPQAPGYDPHAQPDEGPPHTVAVEEFWILRDEVSTSVFGRCVEEGYCDVATVDTSGGFSTYATLQQRRNVSEPINSITWHGAARLCDYLGARLPSEAEWELAARGTDGRTFPWGDEPGCGITVAVSATSSGAAHPREQMQRRSCECLGVQPPSELVGASPYGAIAMAGNLWEWVDDRYGPYGAEADELTDLRVQRGGGWTSTDPVELRSAARGSAPPDSKLNDVGVRCVWGLATP